MANIRVGEYRLRSDRYQWIVTRVKTYASGDKAGEPYDSEPEYHGSLTAALNALLAKALRDSEANSIEELRADIARWRGEVLKVFGLGL